MNKAELIAQQMAAAANIVNIWGGLIVNVKDRLFDAKGDGVTDDTAAIQRAINSVQSAGGGTLILPPGTYTHSSDLNVTGDNINIIGYGRPVLKKLAGCQINIKGNYCSVTGIRFNGNSKAFCGVAVFGSNNSVEWCESYGHNDHGIALDGQSTSCQYNRIMHNHCHNNGFIGIAQNKASDGWIMFNRCNNNGAEGITIDNQAHRNQVSHNHIFANQGGVAGVGIDYSDLNTVSHNIIMSNVKGGIKTQNNLGPSNYNTFDGNIIINNGEYGIWLFDGTGGYANYNTIDANIIRDNTLGALKIDANGKYNIIGNNTYDYESVFIGNNSNAVQSGIVGFLARNGTARTNVTGDGTTYLCQFDTETLDKGLWNCWNGTDTFTAPMTGTYMFVAKFRASTATVHAYSTIQIVASSAGVFNEDLNPGNQTIFNQSLTAFIPLTKGETVQMYAVVGGSVKDATIAGNTSQVFFGGFLVG